MALIARSPEIQVLRESLYDAFCRLEDPRYNPEQIEVIKSEINGYFQRYIDISKERTPLIEKSLQSIVS